MIDDLHLISYALCSWGAALNAPAWLRLLFRQMQPPRAKPWHLDSRFVTRLALVIGSIGITLLEGSRVWTEMTTGAPIPTPSVIGECGIVFMAFAEPLFLRIDEIHAREVGKRSISWRLYWIGAVVGVAMLMIWRLT